MAPITYTPDEAFAIFLEDRYTKIQYIARRDESQHCNDEIFPPYRDITKSMKKCMVKNSLVTDEIAKVPLQNLLDKTTSRLIQSQRDSFEAILQQFDRSSIDAEFVYIYGFSENSKNNNEFGELCSEPGSFTIFATTIIPLRLVTSDGTVLWTNKAPHSVRFCRPVKLQVADVTNEFVLNEKQLLDKEIGNLKMFTFDLGDRKILRMSYKLNLTAIDGKILNILADIDKSSHECPICNASPQDSVKNREDMKATKFAPLNYGISPLHCWIRFYECILEIGYRGNIKKFEIIEDNDKKLFDENKLKIRNLLHEKMPYSPPHQFKSKDTGTTVYCFFGASCDLYHSEMLSEITGVDLNLITNFKMISIILSYDLPIDLNEFELFCSKTAQIFSEKYPWFPMSPVIHKVLVHGRQILENSILPVGNFDEREPEDFCEYECDCQCHCDTKTTRKDILGEIFQRALLLTDPLISTISFESKIKELKMSDVPSDVLAMLDIPNKEEKSEDDENNSDNYFLDMRTMNSLKLESMYEFD